jgi:hypothetical protein
MCNRFMGGGGVCQKRSTLRMLSYVLLAVLLAIPFSLHAQQYSGTITGTVTDPTGAAVPGASITVINSGTNATVTVKADAQGNFTAAQLPVGTYEVRVSQGNFKEYVETGVQVHTSTFTEVKATLQIGQVSQKVTVAATAVQVQTTSASVGEVVDGTQVRELPLNGENFVGLTQLSPGVSAAQGANFEGKGLQGGVNFSVNGNPYNYNLFLIDGMNNNDVGSGRTILVYPSVDTIAEFKMIRNSYGPEYGQAAGAIISITTKSGQNQFHGGAFYAGRNDALDANDWISNDTPNPTKAEERRDDYGYNISGPVVKDKLFFWWNQEWNKEISGVSGTYRTCVPTAAEENGDFSGYGTATVDQCGASIPTIPAFAQGSQPTIINPSALDAAGVAMAKFYPTPNTALVNGNNWQTNIKNKLDWKEWNVRADYDVTKSNRATFRWTDDNWSNPVPNNPTGTFWGDSAFPTVMSNWSQPSRSVMAKLTSTISSTLVNDVEFGFGQNRIITTLGGTSAGIVDQIHSAYPAIFPASIKTPDEFFGWGGLNDYASNLSNSNFQMWNIAPYGNHEDLYAIQDNISKVHGNHLFKAGIYVSSNEKVENSGDGADRPAFPSYSTPTFETNNRLADILMPGAASYGSNAQVWGGIAENSIDGVADVHWHDIEPYFGDTWKIRRNVTIDYGFRWSFFREPYGGTSGGNTNPAFNGGGNYPNQWANWSKSHWSAAEAAANPTDACNGILTVPGTSPCSTQKAFLASIGVALPLSDGTPGPNSALVQQNNHSIAPRVGIAWDVRGDGKTAVRVGGGQFFQREIVGLAENLARNAPFVIAVTSNRSFDTVPTLAPGSANVSPTANKSTGGHIPNSWQWNVSVEQELARNTTLQLGYVANVGEHLTSMYDSNAIPASSYLPATFVGYQTVAQNAFRPADNFSMIGGFARGGHASYQSLQALFRMQTSSNSTFQAAYTWGHSIGNVDLDNSSGTVNNEATTDQSNPGLDKGNTNINRPNIFVANEVLFLPKFASHGAFVQNVLGGWESNSIITLAEGSSLTIYTAGASGGDGANIGQLVGTGYNANNRPLVTAFGCNTGRNGDQILNVSHFTLLGYPLGTFPTNMEHRGTCYGAPNTDVDFQLAKNWMVKERLRIKFSMDFFNLFNHPNFNSANLEGANFTATGLLCGPSQTECTPSNNIVSGGSWPTAGNAAGFGQANAIQGTPRELQYTLRFSF